MFRILLLFKNKRHHNINSCSSLFPFRWFPFWSHMNSVDRLVGSMATTSDSYVKGPKFKPWSVVLLLHYNFISTSFLLYNSCSFIIRLSMLIWRANIAGAANALVFNLYHAESNGLNSIRFGSENFLDFFRHRVTLCLSHDIHASKNNL